MLCAEAVDAKDNAMQAMQTDKVFFMVFFFSKFG